MTQTFGTTNVDVRASGDFRAGPYLYFVQTERARFGLLGGGSWNTLLGPGFNLGVGAVVWLGRNLDLQLSWTVAFYPAAADHLRSAGVTGDPSVPWLQGGGIAIGLLFHP